MSDETKDYSGIIPQPMSTHSPVTGVPIVPPPPIVIPKEELQAVVGSFDALSVPDRVLRTLAELGATVERRGVQEVVMGRSLITHNVLMQTLLVAAQGAAQNPESAMRYAKTICDLANAQHKYDKLLLDRLPQNAVPVAAPKGVGAAFPAGARITQVNNYNITPAPTKEPDANNPAGGENLSA